MSKLDLNAYGVSEMNGAEMREVDGGNWAELAGRVWGHISNAWDAFVCWGSGEGGAAVRQAALASGR